MSSSGRFGYIPDFQAGRGSGLLQVRFQANSILRLVDEITGAFRGGAFQLALDEAHQEAASKIQKGMVSELDRRVRATGRPQTGRGKDHEEGALRISILDPNNRRTNASGFLVGIDDWMDRSPAHSYWRQIELGAWERPVAPGALFTTDFSNMYGPWSQGGSTYQSHARFRRSGGKSKLYSRAMPAGYPHGRLIQGLAHGASFMIGPFPAYKFSRGGTQAFERMDMLSLYRKHLTNRGIKMTSGMVR